MARANHEALNSAVARLRDLRDSGALVTAHVRLAAQGLGLSERSMWRHLRGSHEEREEGRCAYRLSDADREAFAHFRGNVAAVHRARQAVVDGATVAAGVPLPVFLIRGWSEATPVSIRTLGRAFAQQMTPAEAAAWRHGERARRDKDVYLTRPQLARNQVWEMDHTQLPLVVLPPRGPALRPWITTIVDDATRALVGWAISATPHSGTVLTAVRMALVFDAERGPFGAVPAGVRVDRGLEFASNAVSEVLAALCVSTQRLPGYTPHRKGKVERLNRTLDQTLLSSLPGYTGGPRDAAERLYGPVDDSPAGRAAATDAEVGPLRIEVLAERVRTWAHWYNTKRPHSAMDGLTPAQAWQEDSAALHRIDTERLRHLLLAGVERTIGKEGVRLHGHHYLAPELQGRRGQVVQVRFMPHDDRFVEVFADGVHLCTAHPQTQLTAEQVDQFRQQARTEARRLAAQRRRANARARSELAPLTDGSPPAEARLLPGHRGDELASRRRDRQLRQRASTSLLGLHDPAQEPTES